MKKLLLIAFLIGVFSCGAFAEVLLSDNFDYYVNDTDLNGNGRWELNSNWEGEWWVTAANLQTNTAYAVPTNGGGMGAGGSRWASSPSGAAAYLNTDQSHVVAAPDADVITMEFDMNCFDMHGSNFMYLFLVDEKEGAADVLQWVGISMSEYTTGYGGKISIEGSTRPEVSIVTGAGEKPSLHIDYTIDLTNKTIDLAWADMNSSLNGTSGPHSYTADFSPNAFAIYRGPYEGVGFDNLNITLSEPDVVPFLPGDANGDGVVSAGDYAAVQANFGNTLPSDAPSVPEPASVVLVLAGSYFLVRRRTVK